MRSLFLTFLCWLGLVFSAQADVSVYPKSLELDARLRNGAFTLLNNGSQDITVRVSWVDRRMKPDGNLEVVQAGQSSWSAASLLRFSPRQVVIPAGGSQTVRVLYRRPADLPPGDYHSHLTFQELPKTVAVGEKSQSDVSVQISTIFGLSVPVFVEEGIYTPGTLRCAGVRLVPAQAEQPTTIEANLERIGQGRANAAVQVFRQSGAGWQPLTNKQMMVVYPELPMRQLRVPLPLGDYQPSELKLRLSNAATANESAGETQDCALG